MELRENQFDVIVLGTGLAGSIMGAILARAGKKVLLIDSSSHPRFAIGESTVGYTLVHLRMLAHRYGVPEIGNMGSLGETTKHIGSSSGVKRHFGFMIHRDGQYPDPYECNQFRLPKVLHKAVHYYRQDTDAYLFSVAIKYGCNAKQNYRVADIDFHDDKVVVHGEDGQT
ncbi:NAD(P)/FAD-dependent oxidoreductase, partial [Streptomyces capparidis]